MKGVQGVWLIVKYRSDGTFFARACAITCVRADPRACGASSPLVLARVPGVGPPPHVSRAPSSSIARPCFSLSHLIPLPTFAPSFSPSRSLTSSAHRSLDHTLSLSLFFPLPPPPLLGRLLRPLPDTAESAHL